MRLKTTLPVLAVGLMVVSAQAAHAREVAYLGVLLGPVPEVLSAYVKEGALIRDVAPGSPAAKAGLLRNDIIVSGLTTSNVLRPGLAGLVKSLTAEIAPIRINGAKRPAWAWPTAASPPNATGVLPSIGPTN